MIIIVPECSCTTSNCSATYDEGTTTGDDYCMGNPCDDMVLDPVCVDPFDVEYERPIVPADPVINGHNYMSQQVPKSTHLTRRMLHSKSGYIGRILKKRMDR